MRLVQVQVLRVREFDSRPLLFLFRRGVVGNMSGFHPVASGSIPGSGCGFLSKSVWCSGSMEPSGGSERGSIPRTDIIFINVLGVHSLECFFERVTC